MHKFNDLGQTVVLTGIAAFQLNGDIDNPYGQEIHLALTNGVSITLEYSIGNEENKEKYNQDCKYLLNL